MSTEKKYTSPTLKKESAPEKVPVKPYENKEKELNENQPSIRSGIKSNHKNRKDKKAIV